MNAQWLDDSAYTQERGTGGRFPRIRPSGPVYHRRGDVMPVLSVVGKPDIEIPEASVAVILSKIGDTESSGCRPWNGSVFVTGYGRFILNGKHYGAHRVVYSVLRGRIPDGLHIDHLCRNRLCVNPDHLEPVTNRENTARGIGGTAHAARTGSCIYGHELSGDNIRVRPNGKRNCRECDRAPARRLRAAERAS